MCQVLYLGVYVDGLAIHCDITQLNKNVASFVFPNRREQLHTLAWSVNRTSSPYSNTCVR